MRPEMRFVIERITSIPCRSLASVHAAERARLRGMHLKEHLQEAEERRSGAGRKSNHGDPANLKLDESCISNPRSEI